MNQNVSSNLKSVETKSSRWLNEYAKNTTSQSGEDGIIEKILDIIRDTNKWCVEFGCWDGCKLSNTFTLIDKKDYSAVLMECDRKRFQQLLETYKKNPRVIPMNVFVGFEKDNCLDTILGATKIPRDFDLLSIDVDGNDYHIWEAVRYYRPKVVLIEFNATIPCEVEFVQPRDMSVTQGSSLLSIIKLAKSKGYELVAVTSNAIFVDSKYFELFGIRDNSIEVMWLDKSAITYIFCGYDGTIFLRGSRMLPWQQIPYKEYKVQQLPKWARKTVGDRNIFRRKFGKIYRRFCKRNII